MNDEPITVYHNPRCSKSRRAVEILTELGMPFTLYHYLDEKPDADELRRVLAALGTDDPRMMMRTKDAEFAAVADAGAAAQIDAMVEHPALIERPILLRGGRALIARPPERVHELLDS